jgi:hypothetical protein
MNLQSIINAAVVGKIISKQEGIDPSFWGATITGVTPCSFKGKDEPGFVLSTTNIFNTWLTIRAFEEIQFDN